MEGAGEGQERSAASHLSSDLGKRKEKCEPGGTVRRNYRKDWSGTDELATSSAGSIGEGRKDGTLRRNTSGGRWRPRLS